MLSIRAFAVVLIVAFAAEAQKHPVGITPFSTDSVIPQIADGGGWKTTIILINSTDQRLTTPLTFKDDRGGAWALALSGIPQASTSYNISVPPHGQVTLETAESSGGVRQGWALMDFQTGLSGLAIFRQRVPDRPDFEAVVPFGNVVNSRSLLTFDNTAAFVTSFAICNPWSFQSATITVNIRDENGNRLLLDQFTLGPYAHSAIEVTSRWPQASGRRGTIELASNPGYFAVLGLRFNPGGAFTSFHSLDPF